MIAHRSCAYMCTLCVEICVGERGMAGGGTQTSLRKYIGAVKDTTTVTLAKVNSDYKVSNFIIWISFQQHGYNPLFTSVTTLS